MLYFLSLVGIAFGLIVLAAIIECCLELIGFSEEAAKALRQLLYFWAFIHCIQHCLQ